MQRLEDVLIQSVLKNNDSNIQQAAILNAFNKNVVKSCFDISLVRGYWLNPGEFILGARNKVPELAGFNRSRNIAIVWPNPVGVVTEYLSEPFKHTKPFYGSDGSYVLNVPNGYFAKARNANQALLFGSGPHVIHDPTFSFDVNNGFVSQGLAYIQHDTLHILRVPSGKIAKIWIGSEAHLLESRPEAYVFNSPLFRIEKHNDNDVFFDATSPLIVHGAMKRIMPKTGTVAITYNNGIMQIIAPSESAKPTVINSATHEVDGFLNTGIQTLVFPSEETKKSRKKDNPQATTDEVSYDIFTTKDSLKVGVKLLVTYRIKDPLKALSLLGKDGIVPHIENLATVDMGKAIQQSSSQEFLTFYQNKPIRIDVTNKEATAVPIQSAIMHFQDVVKQELASDLDAYGIELTRLNIETPKILNKEIADQMAQQSLLTAKANSQEAVLAQQYNISTTQARQEAEMQTIRQNQLNMAKLSQAQAELDAAKLQAEAVKIRAEAEKQAGLLKGQQYNENDKIFEMEKLRIQMEAFSKAQFIPPQLSNLFTQGMMVSPFGFFANTQLESRGQFNSLPVKKQEEKSVNLGNTA